MEIAFMKVERGASPSAGSRAFIAKRRGLAMTGRHGNRAARRRFRLCWCPHDSVGKRVRGLAPGELTMAHKTMVRAAAVSMLFGGTLGAAHAGVTGVSGNSSSAMLDLAYVYESGTFGVSGSPMDGPVSFSDATFGSITCSQFTSSGFSLTINSTAAANQQSFFVQQNFIVTGSVNFSLTGYLPVSMAGHAFIHQGDTFFAESGSDAGAFSLSGTLQAGEYRFAYFNGATGAESGTLFNLTFTAVPAPGAAALVGLAGMVGGRRRRV